MIEKFALGIVCFGGFVLVVEGGFMKVFCGFSVYLIFSVGGWIFGLASKDLEFE